MPSNETIASLKKKCGLAQKKNFSFYYFAKAENGEPALLIGKAAAVRGEQKALAKEHRTKPVAHGIVKKAESGKGLTFELYKGKSAALKKALKTTFGQVPLLKSASVELHSKKVSLKDKVSGNLKGGSDAFKRRATKLNDAFAAASKVIGALERDRVPVQDAADRLDDLREALDAAWALSETDPKDAYTALAPVKADVQKLLADLKHTQDNIKAQRAQATDAHKAAMTTLAEARKALSGVADAGYETSDEKKSLDDAEQKLSAAQKKIHPTPLDASKEISAAVRTIDGAKAALGKKKGQPGEHFKSISPPKSNTKDFAQRAQKVEAALKAARVYETAFKALGILSADEASALKGFQRDRDKANNIKQLKTIRDNIAAFVEAASQKQAQHAQLIDEQNAAWGLIQRAKDRYEAIVIVDPTIDNHEAALSALTNGLASAEGLVASDMAKATAATQQVRAAAQDLLDEIIAFQKNSPHAEVLTFQTRAEKVQRYLDAVRADDAKLAALLCNKASTYSQQLRDLGSLVSQCEALAKKDVKRASRELKSLRDNIRKVHSNIQDDLKALPEQRAAFDKRCGALSGELARLGRKLDLLSSSRDLKRQQATYNNLKKLRDDALKTATQDLARAHKELDVDPQKLTDLEASLDLMIAEDALSLTDMPLPEAPLAQKRQLALLWVKLGTAKSLSDAKVAAIDEKQRLAQAQNQLAVVTALLERGAPEAGDRLKTATATVESLVTQLEARERAMARVNQKSAQASDFEPMLARPVLWKAFVKFAASEFSLENALFWQSFVEGKFSTPRAKREAYLQFISDGAPMELNISKEERKGCFPDNAFPAPEVMDQWDMWAKVSFDELEAPIQTNLSDTFSRFRLTINAPLEEALKAAPLQDSEKHIARWEAHLG